MFTFQGDVLLAKVSRKSQRSPFLDYAAFLSSLRYDPASYEEPVIWSAPPNEERTF
ncbi:MAG: hypothetical protein ACI8RN_002967 [Glaciecola sp.]|jgi:hypothetical protein